MLNPLQKKLLQKHENLIQSNNMKVISHVQRESGEWFINTLTFEGTDVPFKYKRKKQYKSLKGSKVNVTYYPEIETIAGFDMECMKVVRIRIA